MVAAETYWREQHPTTIREVVRWVYLDNELGEVARVVGPFPAVPIETPETRKHRFVVASDFDWFPVTLGTGMDDDDRRELLKLETMDMSTATDVATLFKVWSNDAETLAIESATAWSVARPVRQTAPAAEVEPTPWAKIVNALARAISSRPGRE